MPLPIHTVEMLDGSNNSNSNKLLVGFMSGLANVAGATNTAVSTAVAWNGELPPNYIVVVNPGQAGAWASVTSKTPNGFNVVLTPLASAAIAAGTFDVLVFA